MRNLSGSMATAASIWIWNTRTDFHYASDSGEEQNFPATNNFALASQTTDVSIPLECYNLTNKTVRINGTIRWTVSTPVSNATVSVSLAQIQFQAQLKPAAP